MIAVIDAVDHDVLKVSGSVVRNASTRQHDDGQQQEDRDVEEERQRRRGRPARGRAGPRLRGAGAAVRRRCGTQPDISAFQRSATTFCAAVCCWSCDGNSTVPGTAGSALSAAASAVPAFCMAGSRTGRDRPFSQMF